MMERSRLEFSSKQSGDVEARPRHRSMPVSRHENRDGNGLKARDPSRFSVALARRWRGHGVRIKRDRNRLGMLANTSCKRLRARTIRRLMVRSRVTTDSYRIS